MTAPETVLRCFPVPGTAASFTPIRGGHINRTWLVTADTGERYILQRVNNAVFPDVAAVMDNASRVADYLERRGEGGLLIRYLAASDGGRWVSDGEGGVWRLYRFVENSVCHRRAENLTQLYESGRGFGAFLHALRDFPVSALKETIPGFHDTPARYRAFRRAVEADVCGRAGELEKEIGFLLSREERASQLQQMLLRGELPLRVTHNDTKISNILMDADTGRAKCVIDLDTVMPGLAAWDFGDGIRCAASSAEESEREPGKARLDPERFRAFARGYLEACPDLTPAELRSLPLGAFTMTLECGMRFLTDYLEGDRYFSVDYAAHNLDRGRTQLRLAGDMEKRLDEVEQILRGLERKP